MLLLILSVGARPQAHEVSSQRTSSPDSHGHLLLLYNTHTAERIDIVYRRGEAYIPEALAKLDFFLRDHRTGDVRRFDPLMYDILSDLTASVGRPGGEIDTSEATAPLRRTNLSALTPRESQGTAFIFRLKPSICGCLASTRSNCARLLSLWLGRCRLLS